MPTSLMAFATFAGGNWYEEDCDWSIVACAFPDLFPASHVLAAVQMIDAREGDYFKGVQVGDRARTKANMAEQNPGVPA